MQRFGKKEEEKQAWQAASGGSMNQHGRLAATPGRLVGQSENCLALFWGTVQQQFDFRITFLPIHRDEQRCHVPGRLAAHPDINPPTITRGRSLQVAP